MTFGLRSSKLTIIAACFAGSLAVAPMAVAQNVFGGFEPGVGDFMNMMIQPRHAKLGLAGEAKNWPLAAYALKELGESFQRVSKGRPKFRNLSIPDMIESTVAEPLKALDAAVKAKDEAKFAEAYGKLTAGCNACHMAGNSGAVVIKTPDHSSFPNQEFAPKR
jgi:hypothetical protein